MQDMRDDFPVENLHPADSLSEIHSDCYTPTFMIGNVKVEVNKVQTAQKVKSVDIC